MIVDLPSTTTANISKKLVRLRSDTGSMALTRVLTLVVVVDENEADEAIETANDASRQHPCRIIVVVTANRRGAARLDAQIRIGGDAGASEVVVLRLFGPLAAHGRAVVTPLLLADAPIVAWWPTDPPKDPGADPIGGMAQRRVTDVSRTKGTPKSALGRLARSYAPGDTDLSWSRITLWRALLTAALDQAPFEPVTSVTVTGGSDSPSAELLAGWLAKRLRCPVTLVPSRVGSGIISVRLERDSGPLDLVRPQNGTSATLSQPGTPERSIALPPRSDAECLADELRRLDPDEPYADALRDGLDAVSHSRRTSSESQRKGITPSVAEAREDAERIKRESSAGSSSAMVEAAPMPDKADDPAQVQQAAATKLEKVRVKRATKD
ncbi:glucose-6-phosphate dehydrogenase assembly protein OpcA [Knoellia locipacati]|uniref:Glucose-6-phosphate dehydrogenase assembly protein OpcA n=1 Tax=Knoellia locipacati TaxID=882824 RepID=A0A512T2J2_9MICO|nr:glucose-6-phosphate dehydrogenase assembly protein OpcA [Knoellia locipacati]GEQ14439.1 glucose-6-phosphate dehydrogenase assembly protein OpcA [Knoellia locipacati]